ncbi:MAG TPA: FkbM family methyltransferase [Rubricoccaceae bacterium]|jgi:FkbM family methyltransferase
MNIYKKRLRELLIKVFKIDIKIIGKNSLTYRSLEYDISKLIDKSNPTVIDVGANRGQTIDMIRGAFGEPKIWAFEPNEELANQLKQRYADLSVVVEHAALGAQEEIKKFFHYENSELSSFLFLEKNNQSPFSEIKIKDEENLKMTTLDIYCKKNDIIYIDLLKIDTQGFDLEVLKGAVGLFRSRSVGVVQVEINFAPLYEGQAAAGELIDWLRANRFGLIGLYEQVRAPKALAWATACFLPVD